MGVHHPQVSSSAGRQNSRICVTGKCFHEDPISPARYDTALRETAMARSTAKARTAPSAPRQGQCSTTSELSRKPGSQFLQVERFSHCTLAPTKNDRSASLSVRINPKGPGEYVHARNCWLVALTLVVVTLLTRRYDFWRATGEPFPKPSVTPPKCPAILSTTLGVLLVVTAPLWLWAPPP